MYRDVVYFCSGVSCCPAENGVLAELLSNPSYMKYSRPVKDMSETLNIQLQLKVLKVIEVVSIKALALSVRVHSPVRHAICKVYKPNREQSTRGHHAYSVGLDA